MKGVNLGGWLSQCNYDPNHLREFIKESDIKKIKSWGMDHVRLPFDFNIVQDAEGNLKEEGFALLDSAVQWCKDSEINIILDLHKAQGFSFRNTWFSKKMESLKGRFARVIHFLKDGEWRRSLDTWQSVMEKSERM